MGGISSIDGRSSRLIRKGDTKTFKTKARRLADAMGGVDNLNEGQCWLVRTATQLSIETETLEAARSAGKEIDLREYGMLCDRLGRTLQRLGLEPEKVEKPEGVQIIRSSHVLGASQLSAARIRRSRSH